MPPADSESAPLPSPKAEGGTCGSPSTRSRIPDTAPDAALPHTGHRLPVRCRHRTECFVVPNHISFSYPFVGDEHRALSIGRSRLEIIFIASPPARCAIFAWRGIKCFLPFLRWCSTSRRPCAISIRDNASTQKPSAREASTASTRRQSSCPVPGASNRALDSPPAARPRIVPGGCTLHPKNRFRPEHLPYAHSVSANDQGRGW